MKGLKKFVMQFGIFGYFVLILAAIFGIVLTFMGGPQIVTAVTSLLHVNGWWSVLLLNVVLYAAMGTVAVSVSLYAMAIALLMISYVLFYVFVWPILRYKEWKENRGYIRRW